VPGRGELNLEPLEVAREAQFVRANLHFGRHPVTSILVLCDPPTGPLDVASLLKGVGASRGVIEE